MGASNIFRKLSQILEQYESGRAEIRRVEVTRPDQDKSSSELRATVDIAVPLCATLSEHAEDDLSPTSAAIREDGGLQINFPSSSLPTANRIENGRVSVEEADSVRIEDGTVLVTSIVTIADGDETEQLEIAARKNSAQHTCQSTSEGTVDSGRSTDEIKEQTDERKIETRPDSTHTSVVEGESPHKSEFDAVRTEGLPPFEDTEYLQRIYESCDTFNEMADVIEMDVSAETARRYMSEAGVHEPDSYNTVSSSNAENGASPERNNSSTSSTRGENTTGSPENDPEVTAAVRQPDGMDSEGDDSMKSIRDKQLVADGIGLPNGVTIDRLADAVESSITIHEVTRELNIDRDEARQLLERLNLLDLVLTRVWKEDSPRVSRAEIAGRLRQSVTSDSSPP
ncbi:hypothetical protein [Haladaptatus sp. DFWS20]|uniref:hypothetical protein n=1 Tax=Haladaptatus sp. DFWS20 TaxID=3403467 RepID=UPI003EC03C77